jgi:hypothetical protein
MHSSRILLREAQAVRCPRKRCSKRRRKSTDLAVLHEPGGPNQGRQALGRLNLLETTVGLSASLLAQGNQCPVVAINFATCRSSS